MMGKGTNESRPVTLAEVKRILEKRQGTAGEFGYEQQTTLSYAQRFSHLSHSEAEAMLKEVEELGVPASCAVKVVDLIPKNKPQLMLILAKDKVELPEKKLAELEETIAKFSKKAKKLEPPKIEDAKPKEPAPEDGKKEGEKAKEADEKEEKTN